VNDNRTAKAKMNNKRSENEKITAYNPDAVALSTPTLQTRTPSLLIPHLQLQN
jgi:hypothetical protein